MPEAIEEGYRALAADIHDIDDTKHQMAVDLPIALDSYQTDFGARCFEDGWRKQLPAMLENHDTSRLIGHVIDAQSLTDRHRLIGQFSDFDDVPNARAAFAHVRDGDYPGTSFHFVNGKSVPHPEVRGARRYTQARMLEVSPVLYPSIPGATATGLRSEEPTVAIPTLDQILALQAAGNIDEEGVRALVAEHYPYLGDHFKGQRTEAPDDDGDAPSLDSLITLHGKGLLDDDGLHAAIKKYHPTLAGHIKVPKHKPNAEHVRSVLVDAFGEDGIRDMTITIAHDGQITANGPTSDGGTVTDDGAEEQQTLVQGIDACLDQAAAAIGDTDLTSLPDNIQQAISLVYAAGVAVDELQNVLGIADPDDPLEDEGGRSVLTTKEENDLPDTSFAVVEPGGVKDGSGKTVPRNKRHYPLEKTPGKLDPDHVHNAISRIGAALNGDNEESKDIARKAIPKVKAAAKELKIDAPSLDDAGKRSADDLTEDLRERFGVTDAP